MEIRAGGPGQEPVSVSVTMRTPGADFDLAVGFLFTEGLIRSREEIAEVNYCDSPTTSSSTTSSRCGSGTRSRR